MFKEKIRVCKFCQRPFKSINCSQYYCSLRCRFWAKVEKVGSDDCWNWTGGRHQQGYGLFQHKGSTHKAHRFAWLLTYGSIPDNLCVLHHCDNTSCCNPAHLFLGSQTDNMRDMFKKSRQPHRYGENNARAKLTENQVKEIRGQLINGTKARILAIKYKVNQQTIWAIKYGRNWSHIIRPAHHRAR